jgi:hypothetical protein
MVNCGFNPETVAKEAARFVQPPAQAKVAAEQNKKDEEFSLGELGISDSVDISFAEEGRISMTLPTSVVYTPESVRAPKLGATPEHQVERWRESYKKACQQAKGSPNLMLSLSASADVAKYGLLLFTLGGVSFSELGDLRKEALSELYKQNRQLFAENERNFVLVKVSGGKKKKTELRLISEIRNQLTLQARRLGKPYSQLDIYEMQLEQAGLVREKFGEEVASLKGQKELLETYAFGKA